MSNSGQLVHVVLVMPLILSLSLFCIALPRAHNVLPALDQVYNILSRGSYLSRHISAYYARVLVLMRDQLKVQIRDNYNDGEGASLQTDSLFFELFKLYVTYPALRFVQGSMSPNMIVTATGINIWQRIQPTCFTGGVGP